MALQKNIKKNSTAIFIFKHEFSYFDYPVAPRGTIRELTKVRNIAFKKFLQLLNKNL